MNRISSALKIHKAFPKLLHLSTVSRSDISGDVGILYRKMDSPDHHDWKAVKKMIQYLIKTPDLKLNPRLDWIHGL